MTIPGGLWCEDHAEGEDGGGRVDDQLPRIGEMEDGARDRPAQREQGGDPKREALPHPSGGQGGEPIEWGLAVRGLLVCHLVSPASRNHVRHVPVPRPGETEREVTNPLSCPRPEGVDQKGVTSGG